MVSKKKNRNKRKSIQNPVTVYRAENRDFFENAPTIWLKNLAEVKGFSTNIDLEFVSPYINESLNKLKFSVLEIGFGYGRVLRWIRKKNSFKKILAIDHSRQFFLQQKNEFSADENIEFIRGSILNCKINQPVDVAFWMWATIFELNDKDKLKTLKKISKSLVKNGKLIIEIWDELVGHKNVEYIDDKYFKVKTEHGNLNVFPLTADKIEEIGLKCELSLIKNIPYLTVSKIKRRLLIFEKK